MNRARIKICYISSVEEARLAVAAGADALGLVSTMPSGPGVISDSEIANIAATVPPGVATFLLTCRQASGDLIEQIRKSGVNTVQLCDALPTDSYAELRAALPNVRLVQVIHVHDDDSISEALKCAPHVDALLLDSGNPRLAVKELGGTGRVHNWELSRTIVKTCAKPVWLAGGLNANRVKEAWNIVQPFGFDICSGLRTDGNLDQEKLKTFIATVRSL